MYAGVGNNDDGSNWGGCMVLVRIKHAIGLFLSNTYHFLTDNSLQSADPDQQESRAVAGKLHDAAVNLTAAVNFDTYQNLQRHRAVLPAIAWLSC